MGFPTFNMNSGRINFSTLAAEMRQSGETFRFFVQDEPEVYFDNPEDCVAHAKEVYQDNKKLSGAYFDGRSVHVSSLTLLRAFFFECKKSNTAIAASQTMHGILRQICGAAGMHRIPAFQSFLLAADPSKWESLTKMFSTEQLEQEAILIQQFQDLLEKHFQKPEFDDSGEMPDLGDTAVAPKKRKS